MTDIKTLLKEQAARKKKWAKIPHHDNSKDYAGSPMRFRCLDCGAEIIVPEDYTPPRQTHCDDCEYLNRLRA